MARSDAAGRRRRGGGEEGAGAGERPRRLPVNPDAPDPDVVAEAAAALGAGALVAFPTDTLYALAADPFQAEALARVFTAKGRSDAKAVSLLVADQVMAARFAAAVPGAARLLMEQCWPGAVTIIVPAAPGLPPSLAPPGGGVGLRAPRAATAQAILRALGRPLVGTSANRAGGPDPRDAPTVLQEVGRYLELILDGGATPLGAPSTVVDCTGDPPRLLRAGVVPLAWLRRICPDLRTP